MTSCPNCGKDVDPLRSRAVGVRDGKIVSYCSKECQQAAETKPTASPVITSAKQEREIEQKLGRAMPTQGARAKTEPPSPPSKATPAKGVPKLTPPKGVPKATPPQGVGTVGKETPSGGVGKATPSAGVPKGNFSLDSGPVIEIVHEPASGVVTSAADARTAKATTATRAETSGAIQIADTGHLDDYINADQPIHKSRAWVVIMILIVLGGGAFAAYQLGLLDTLFKQDSHAATPPPPPPVVVETPDAAVPKPQPSATDALDRAREVLRKALRSDSPRVQRVAASALARTGDPEAIAALAAALTNESSDLAKLDVLYALARGGDKRGSEGLVTALQATRRDVRAEAARRLALLGDKRAIDTLAQYLDVSQLRLGAAEQLAYLAEPRAVKALEAVRADDKALPDDKARAAIALGHAGKTEIAPALRELLADARFNAFAAASLASLHDAAARPVLVKLLEVSSLRINAARSLRQLDAMLNPLPLLPPLVKTLTSAKDTEQVQAAETILIIAGPPEWSAHE